MRTRRFIFWIFCSLTFVFCIALIGIWQFSDSYWVSRGYNIVRKHADRVLAAWYQRQEPIGFQVKKLQNLPVERPTSLQFGPDGKLYVSSQDGTIYCIEVDKNTEGVYHAKKVEKILLIKQITNHCDIGHVEPNVHSRQVTGILVAGTPEQPKIYVTSSDPRIGGIIDSTATDTDGDLNLDTNSGILSVLYRNNHSWQRLDLVRGLPRSEENHGPNGMALDTTSNTLYLACGGNTNAGSPSRAYGMLSEYAYSAAILSVQLDKLASMPTQSDHGSRYVYNLPTVDDPTRSNTADGHDEGDPFGGNNGLNQAKIDPSGPVKIFSPGYRNPYDLVITGMGSAQQRIFTIDNGPNIGHGGYPDQEQTPAVSSRYVEGEPGSVADGLHDHAILNLDNLHLVHGPGMSQPNYGGHPNPIRANPDSAGLSWTDGGRHFSKSPTRDCPPRSRCNGGHQAVGLQEPRR